MSKKVISGVNDLATLYPDITSQWHPERNKNLLPQEVLPGSKNAVWWQCEQGHEWEANINNRTHNKSGCPYCSGRYAVIGVNDLVSINPGLAQEWNTIKNDGSPDHVTVSSSKKVWWQCKLGHEWEATVANRHQGTGCPFCSGKSVLSGFNDLQTLYPLVSAQWDMTKNVTHPHQVTAKCGLKAWWLCDKKHSWQATVASRTTAGTGCPYCAGQRAITGVTDASTLASHLLPQWHPTKNAASALSDFSVSSNQKVWWICEHGHEWMCRVADRSRSDKPTACPKCNTNTLFSRAEREISDILHTLGFNVQNNIRSVLGSNCELDIYIPEHNFAIEFNGLYWHTEEAGKDSSYHAIKHQKCQNKGITLYQIWEDDWNLKKELVIRGILYRLHAIKRLHEVRIDQPKHYTQTTAARHTVVEEISYTQAKAFLHEHHIQGSALGTHYLALRDAQRLVAVLVLTKTSHKREMLISRYATVGLVPGGFTKLLAYAEATYKPQRWVTFADLTVSDGALYQSAGFLVDRILAPDYMYVVNKRRVHKFNYRLKRFRTDPHLTYVDGLSEKELAVINKIPRIWDAGKIRYIKDVPQ